MDESKDIEDRLKHHLAAGQLEQAASLAIKEYGPGVLGFLSAVLRDNAEADEIMAMVCLDLWAGLTTFRAESTFRTWTYALARHAYLRYRKRRGLQRRMESPLSQLSWLSALHQRVRTATSPFLRSEARDAISRLRSQLSPEEQTLLVLRVDRGMSWDEVTGVMAPPECGAADRRKVSVACRKRFERTVKKLRHLASEAGLLEEAEP